MILSVFTLISAGWAAPQDLDGVWLHQEGRIEVSTVGKATQVRLLLRDELVQEGPIREAEGTYQAAMDGCGAVLNLIGEGKLKLDLDGPECPIELIGEYALAGGPKAPTHCADRAESVFSCTIPGKGKKPSKRLDVCKLADHSLRYQFGPLGRVELTLNNGVRKERALASGMEYTLGFENDGYTYSVFVVESSRVEDNGAGVVVSKAGKDIATLSCESGWYRAETP